MNKEELISYLNNIDFENTNIVYNEIKKLVKENEKLKQAVRNTYETSQEMLAELTKQNEFLMKRENKLQVLEMKEKEFIKYLEDEIKTTKIKYGNK